MFCSAYFEPWNNYNHPLVRQLAFAIASANLIQQIPDEIQVDKKIELHNLQDWKKFYYAYAARLTQLDKTPQELINFLSHIKSTRLGLRFEALLWFWLQDGYNPHFKLLGHSIQSHKDGKTLGEIDFLIHNLETHEIEHWEVCLKYYLAQSNLKLDTWIGLNPDDTLQHKLQHTCSKQFQFDSALNHKIEKRYMIFKGQLFLPLKHAPIPKWMNPDRKLSYWHHKPLSAKGFIHLTRVEWLCPNAYSYQDIANLSPIKFWHSSLYYHPKSDKFIMLKLPKRKMVYL